MCYAKPGPRCSSHALEQLEKAKKKYKEDATVAHKEQYLLRRQDWFCTPAGIKYLKSINKDKESEFYQARRRQMIAEYRISKLQESKEYNDKSIHPSKETSDSYRDEIKSLSEEEKYNREKKAVSAFNKAEEIGSRIHEMNGPMRKDVIKSTLEYAREWSFGKTQEERKKIERLCVEYIYHTLRGHTELVRGHREVIVQGGKDSLRERDKIRNTTVPALQAEKNIMERLSKDPGFTAKAREIFRESVVILSKMLSDLKALLSSFDKR